ncbi:MAG: response regulator, partial [Thermoanaerobaculaceae bacterium]|nr:response regulator [Thermoanaerobaculaceae bacterium]
ETQQRLAVVGEVAGGLAHDLNNILQAIMVFPEGVRGRTVDPKVQEVLDVVADQAQRGATLIRRILDFSRRSTTERRTVDVVPFAAAIAGLLRRALPETVAVSFAGPPAPGLHISADPTQLEQILLNLALNARDAMPEGGTFGLSVEPLNLAPDATPPIARMPPGEWVHIAAADTGCGIAPEHLNRIFEPYFTTKPKGKGTGLGLAQVYGLVGQNDGFIAVASTPGRHTTFNLYFPIVPAEASPEPAVAVETPGGAGQTILLAEDEPEVRGALRTMLEVLGYRVLEAPDGRAALAHLEAGERPDLLLTDSTMPGMSGAELIVAARRLRPQLKVLALTGYSAEGVLAKLRESGADEILSKPASVDQLARTVARVLTGSGP